MATSVTLNPLSALEALTAPVSKPVSAPAAPVSAPVTAQVPAPAKLTASGTDTARKGVSLADKVSDLASNLETMMALIMSQNERITAMQSAPAPVQAQAKPARTAAPSLPAVASLPVSVPTVQAQAKPARTAAPKVAPEVKYHLAGIAELGSRTTATGIVKTVKAGISNPPDGATTDDGKDATAYRGNVVILGVSGFAMNLTPDSMDVLIAISDGLKQWWSQVGPAAHALADARRAK